MMDTPLSQRLVRARNSLRRRVLGEFCLSMLGLGVLATVILDALDRTLGLREETALVAVGGVVVAVLLLAAALLLRLLLRFPSVRTLALHIEARRPELLDSLICGVEVEQRPAAERSVLERILLTRAEKATATLDFTAEAIPSRFAWPLLALEGILFVLLAVVALNSQIADKTRFRLLVLSGGADAGLTVSPGDTEVPLHSDVTVTSEIRRWDPHADILFRDSRGLHRYRMVTAGNENPAFTFFNLREAVRYRVVTPALRSPWYTLAVFEPPVIRQFLGRVVPPAYTGLIPTPVTQGQDIKTVIGSRLEATVTVATGVRVCLVADGQEVPLRATSPTQWELDWPITRSQNAAFRLRDRAGHQAEASPFHIECLPDFPPVLELLPPAHDQETTPEAAVIVAARAADDFGLADIAISYSIAGQGRKVRSLFPPPRQLTAPGPLRPVREQGVQAVFDPLHLGLKDGDVVSYFFTATDNRQPHPQTVRSAVLFLTVRDEIQHDASRQASGETQKLDIGALLAEQKRLIRLSWDLTELDAAERLARTPELRSNVKDLALEIRKAVAKAAPQAGADSANDPIAGPLTRSAQELDMAEALLGRALLDEAIPPQERSLAALIAAETELLKNAAAAAAKESAGKGKPGEQKPEEAKSPAPQPGQNSSARDALNELRKFLEETRRLSREQEELNRQLEPLAKGTPTAAELAAPAATQRNIGKRARDLTSAMAARPFCDRPAREVDGAATTMTGGVRALESGDAPDGHRQGVRAQLALMTAVQSLEALHRQAAGAEIRRLAEKAQQLSEAQHREAEATAPLAQQTTPTTDAETAKRQQGQSRLQEASRMLQEEVGRSAAALEESFPEAAGAIGNAAQKSRDENVDGTMTRAGNALLYRKFDKATQLQGEAADGLKRMAKRLNEALQQLPSASREELAGALARIRQAKEAVKEAQERRGAEAAKRLQQVQAQMQGEMDSLGSAVPDPAIQRLGESFRETLDPDPAQAGSRLMELLTAAERVLEKRLTAGELQRRLLLKRKVSRIPEGYRDLIDNYFKDLSESE